MDEGSLTLRDIPWAPLRDRNAAAAANAVDIVTVDDDDDEDDLCIVAACEPDPSASQLRSHVPSSALGSDNVHGVAGVAQPTASPLNEYNANVDFSEQRMLRPPFRTEVGNGHAPGMDAVASWAPPPHETLPARCCEGHHLAS